MEHTNSLSRTASWVIREKVSKAVLFETYNRMIVDRLNTEKYEAVPILQYLQEFNQSVRGL